MDRPAIERDIRTHVEAIEAAISDPATVRLTGVVSGGLSETVQQAGDLAKLRAHTSALTDVQAQILRDLLGKIVNSLSLLRRSTNEVYLEQADGARQHIHNQLLTAAAIRPLLVAGYADHRFDSLEQLLRTPESIQQMVDNAAKKIDEAKKASRGAGLDAVQTIFKRAGKKAHRSANRWAVVLGVFVALTVAWLVYLLCRDPVMRSVLSPEAHQPLGWEWKPAVVFSAVLRAAVLGLLIACAEFASRMYRGALHRQVASYHRAHVANSLVPITNAVDESHRSATMVHLADIVCGPGDFGVLGHDRGLPTEKVVPSIQPILDRVPSIGP